MKLFLGSIFEACVRIERSPRYIQNPYRKHQFWRRLASNSTNAQGQIFKGAGHKRKLLPGRIPDGKAAYSEFLISARFDVVDALLLV